MKTLRAALLCLPFLVACGDGAPAEDYAGTWLITSITTSDPFGAVTVTRDGAPMGLRGDVVFAPTGDATAAMHVRQIALEDGVPTGRPMSADMTVEVEDGRWIVTEDSGQVSVFNTALHQGEHLVLTPDPADPRHTAEDPPLEVVAMKAPAWGNATVGVWDLVMMEIPGDDMIANMCTELVPGQAWGKAQMMIVIDSHLVFERWLTVARYADPMCRELVSMAQSPQYGLAEEEDGVLRLWAHEGERGEYLSFAITQERVMTLTRTACLPMPGCAEEAPTTVVVTGR
jgi:hypothetical protein